MTSPSASENALASKFTARLPTSPSSLILKNPFTSSDSTFDGGAGRDKLNGGSGKDFCDGGPVGDKKKRKADIAVSCEKAVDVYVKPGKK